MIGFFELFPEKMETDLRGVFLTDEERIQNVRIPKGMYYFTEFYCPDLGCDCQQLIIRVRRPLKNCLEEDAVATFNYTWGRPLDYLQTLIVDESQNPFLDPLHPQAKFAGALKNFWYQMYLHDKEYAERIKRHYAELRKYVAEHKEDFEDLQYRKVRYDSPDSEIIQTLERKKRNRLLQQKLEKKSRRKR